VPESSLPFDKILQIVDHVGACGVVLTLLVMHVVRCRRRMNRFHRALQDLNGKEP